MMPTSERSGAGNVRKLTYKLTNGKTNEIAN